jgi:hypothetical protein
LVFIIIIILKFYEITIVKALSSFFNRNYDFGGFIRNQLKKFFVVAIGMEISVGIFGVQPPNINLGLRPPDFPRK